jgi:HAMP domain-containing protein
MAFKANSDLKYNDAFDGDFYRYSQPIYVQESCLKCHGDPKGAPADVIAKYGDKRAFGYKVGDVRGIISVKLPDVTVADVLRTFLNPYTIGLIVAAFLLNFLFTHTAIIKRLRNLALTTERIAQGDLDLPLTDNPGSRDEVDTVRHAIDLLRNSVVVAMKRLQKNLSS